jgi:hypothetical protein
MLIGDGNCFRCGEPGHWADHCDWLTIAETRADHQARIDRIVERWINGEIRTAREKQGLIKAENELWNNREKTGARK